MRLVIVALCLLSERYLIHSLSYYRFHWFDAYLILIKKYLLKYNFLNNSYGTLCLIIGPILLITYLILTLFSGLLFGLLSFVINLLIFYYCLGPANPFYPNIPEEYQAKDFREEDISANYFLTVNQQLFGVIFWFVFFGALGAVLYRLLYLCSMQVITKNSATKMISILDWVTVRISLLFYLLVGNFQQGLQYYKQMFFASPEHNSDILKSGGLLAARQEAAETVALPYAQIIVEHALIVYLIALIFVKMAV